MNFLRHQYYLNDNACPWPHKLLLWLTMCCKAFQEPPPKTRDTWTEGCTLVWAMAYENSVCSFNGARLTFNLLSAHHTRVSQLEEKSSYTSRAFSWLLGGAGAREERWSFTRGCYMQSKHRSKDPPERGKSTWKTGSLWEEDCGCKDLVKEGYE